MLFAKTLYDMYCSYIEHKGWHYYIAEEDLSQLGGIRHVSLLVEGPNAYSHLKFESGVHRVQRVPSTEKSGRVHTSTVTVAVIPQPEDVDVSFNEKDLVIETKRSSGAGGQHVNTTDSAVRITHLPSGVVVECQTERSQIKNKAIALARLKAKLYQQQLDEKNNIVRCTRKSQIGIGARSDKIRTYNFNQDRITDHRLSCNIHNLPEFVKGGSLLDQLINNLMATSLENQFDNFISQIKNKNI
ncbi:hypothetical protein AAG570_008360 [Ranatra chinensis]|uniref:Prokaryotic-type class I peptide chain release factors domain-containing protein n=1 Tax=Ranatra chinensis TaxID=642074 RepID=A0ABD0Y674_9HEMI